MIDLRSDTVTQPTRGMLEAMFRAKSGDDVFGEDPTIIELQDKLASYFGKEAGLFCPSGTMCNQIAIRVHTNPGDEVICSDLAHIYLYEGGGIAKNSGCSVRLYRGDRGRLNAKEIESAINPDDAHFPVSRLVSLEDTCNKGGGSCYDLNEIREISAICKEKKLSIHLDGARVFNALVAKGHDPVEYGKNFDSISICLSKGLGAPVGSVLLGSEAFIHQSHRERKAFGGGMRQAGYLAAAGIHGLDYHVDRLVEDHKRAKHLAVELQGCSFVEEVIAPETNIVIFILRHGLSSEMVLPILEKEGLKAVPFGPDKIRFVTHLDFGDDDLTEVIRILRTVDL